MFSEINREVYSRLPFVLTTIAENQLQGDIDRPNGLEHHQFIWVSQGKGVFNINNETFVLCTGQGVFFRSGVPHSYKGIGDFKTCWLTFCGCDNLLDFYNISQSLTFNVSPQISASTTELNHICSGGSTVVSRSAAGYSWLCSVLEEVFQPTIPIENKVRQFMENYYYRPLSLDDVALSVNMNRYTLCRYYHEKCGIKLMDQLKKIRISKAKHYLKYSSKPLEEIGRLCGFDSPSYFGKIFREETMLSPREYRKKNQ